VIPIRLAIVDDHKLFRQGIINLLKTYPHFNLIIEAESCPQLLEALAVAQPDIILMDIEMPDIDGMQGCKQILQLYPEMKIIALSMHTADNFIFHMMKLGARSYLHKDIDQDGLREAIEEVAA
jgi:DNA-binding NarL/FixJ family response regulator